VQQALGLTTEFTDHALDNSHPFVSQRLLQKLHQIDERLFLCWELQHYFDHRWHVKYLDTHIESGTPIETSIVILQWPYAVQIHETAAYLPFDGEALATVRRLMHQIRNGTQSAIIEGVHVHQEKKETDQIADREDMATEMDKEQRRLQERISGKRNISDPGWERGVGQNDDGTYYTDGPGAHSHTRTKAI
jgi:hypothetical protein